MKGRFGRLAAQHVGDTHVRGNWRPDSQHRSSSKGTPKMNVLRLPAVPKSPIDAENHTMRKLLRRCSPQTLEGYSPRSRRAPKLSKSSRTGVQSLLNTLLRVPRFGHKSAIIGQSGPFFGHLWPSLARACQALASIHQNRPSRANMLAIIWATLADIGGLRGKFGQILAFLFACWRNPEVSVPLFIGAGSER